MQKLQNVMSECWYSEKEREWKRVAVTPAPEDRGRLLALPTPGVSWIPRGSFWYVYRRH